MSEIERPKTSTINDNKYYNVQDLKNYNKTYFYGFVKTPREIIERKKIPKSEFIYATYNENKESWTIYKENEKLPNKAILYISKSWTESNVPKMIIQNGNDNAEVKNDEENECQEAPEILELEDEEKFKDDEGNIVEIETRGERSPDGIYFLVKDVACAFEIPNLIRSIVNKDSLFIENIHYKKFITHKLIQTVNKANKKETKMTKYLFITYKGMLKTLFGSKSGRADKFVDWATKTLFTAQMGEKEDKEELASKLIGIPAKSLRQVLSTSTSSVPCLYRFSLGKVKDLRKSMKIDKTIPDDSIVIKYGFTDDLVRRTNEHIKTYGKIKGCKFELMNYTYIDPKYLSEAEALLKDYLIKVGTQLKYENYKELVIINMKDEKLIIRQFKMIATTYAGCVKDLLSKIENLQHQLEIEKIKHQKELDEERHQKELAIEKNKCLIEKNINLEQKMKYETENLNLKLQLEIMKNSQKKQKK